MGAVEDAKERMIALIQEALGDADHLVGEPLVVPNEEQLAEVGRWYAKLHGIDQVDPDYVVDVTMPDHITIRYRKPMPPGHIMVTFSVEEPTDG